MTLHVFDGLHAKMTSSWLHSMYELPCYSDIFRDSNIYKRVVVNKVLLLFTTYSNDTITCSKMLNKVSCRQCYLLNFCLFISMKHFPNVIELTPIM